MTNNHTPLTWLDIIDEALAELPPEAFTETIAQACPAEGVERAQLLLQDVLNGHMSVEQLLSPVCVPERDVLSERDGQPDLSRPET